MPYNLPQMTRRTGKRRNITLRPTVTPSTLATDLAAIYAPAWRLWQDNVDRILTGYNPTPLTTDSPEQVSAAIDAIASEFLTRLVATITPSLRQWLIRSERIHRSKWAAAVKAGTGVEIEMLLSAQPVEEPLSAWLARNVALCRNVSEQAQGRIADAVFRGYQNRTPVREVAKEIREASVMGRDRSVRIAAHQNAALSSALDDERMAEAGLDMIRWRHSGKRDPRSWHKARDGKLYYLKSHKPVDGGEVIAADDWVGRAPFCGCRGMAYIALLDEIE